MKAGTQVRLIQPVIEGEVKERRNADLCGRSSAPSRLCRTDA